jgi:hypothetical protein
VCKARDRLATAQSRNERETVRENVIVCSVRKLRRESKPPVAFFQVDESWFVDVVFAESSLRFSNWPACTTKSIAEWQETKRLNHKLSVATHELYRQLTRR